MILFNVLDCSSDEMESADLRAIHSERTQGVARKRELGSKSRCKPQGLVFCLVTVERPGLTQCYLNYRDNIFWT